MPTSPGAISPVPCPNTCAIHCLISLSDIFIWFIFIFIWYLVTILVTMMKVTATTHGSLRVIQIFTRSPNSSKQTLGWFIFSFSQSRIFCWMWQDLAYSSNQSAEEEFSQPPWSCNAWFRHNLSTANFPPKFLSEETKVCSAFTWLVLRSVLNMDTKSLPEGGPSGKV